MSKHFDVFTKTLTDAISKKPSVTKEPAATPLPVEIPPEAAVPKGRTSIKIPRKSEATRLPIAAMTPSTATLPNDQPAHNTADVGQTPAVFEPVELAKQTPAVSVPVKPVEQTPAVFEAVEPAKQTPAVVEPVKPVEQTPAVDSPAAPSTPVNVHPETAPAVFDPLDIAIDDAIAPAPSASPRTEMEAALLVRARMKPKKPKPPVQPGDMVQYNFRLPKYLKDAFDKDCHDRAVVPTDVLRNYIKSRCGM